ncbi:hypothetical protein CspeluHIS016_0902370 [Cutaneotrichosporon spelunceum]|uniref:B-block binding subunit of TFIIIC domain-containing protein n=1 Tax=Cutaneotrichosporon spelunceum TaxID=1672016 RepID=A0AAD3YE90_9TREE|nr:hypothetical protein CspeluHIS016_0902370 [Cutaneotrichosporon spelunceum]
MRIHELLEAVIDYVVVEGVLGADPLVVQKHLATLDPKVDDAYFAHLWPHIASHKLVRIVVAEHALTDPNPFPHPDGTELFTFLGEDDGGDPPVKTADLRALMERYPDRVRMRCVDDEVYYRLTGSRQRIPRITPMIFTYLQLSARSREKGISALELGPLTQTNQKSVFHYIRVLVQLGLCAKIPASLHGANTSILVFRKFLDQNPNYRAHMRKSSQEPETKEGPKEEDTEDAPVPEEDGEVENLGFNFAPFSEMELGAGHIPRERLIRVLDHPGLKNHLLGNHHLLQVLGWPTQGYKNRHRRQLQRHIAQMVDEGIVEYVDIGNTLRACLRLTKYNPDYVPPVKAEEVEVMEEVPMSPVDYAEPFHFHGGAIATASLESQVINSIHKSGPHGRTLQDLYISLSGIFRRTLEHIINRIDLVFLAPHLKHKAIRCVIESVQRERRLRLFSIDNYVKHMAHLGIVVTPPPTPPAAGHWADLSFRKFVENGSQLNKAIGTLSAGIIPVGSAYSGGAGRKRGPRKSATVSASPAPGLGKRKPRASVRSRAAATEDAEEAAQEQDDGSERAASPGPIPKKKQKREVPSRQPKYDNDVQERGRPRKYVYVVNQDGTRNRMILGDLKLTPALPPLLVYVKEAGVLCLPPKGYSGVGEPPTLTEEAIAAGLPPEHYGPAKRGKGKPKAKGTAPAKGRKRKAGKGEGEDEGEAPAEAVPEAPNAGPSKRPRRMAAMRKPFGELPPDFEPEEGAEMDELAAEPGGLDPDAMEVIAELVPGAEEAVAAAAFVIEQTVDMAMTFEPVELATTEIVAPSTPVDTEPVKVVDQTAAVAADVASPPTAIPTPPAKPPPKPRREKKALIDAADKSVAVETEAAKRPRRSTRAGRAAEMPVEDDITSVAEPARDAVNADVSPVVETAEPFLVSTHPVDGEGPESAAAEAIVTGSLTTAGIPFFDVAGPADRVETTPDLIAVDEPERKPQPVGRLTRVDVATLRRIQELLQCLIDSGGVMTDNKLYHEHKDWVNKWAGTDHPFAPAVPAGMDRKVFKRVLAILVNDGRIKERITNMPTTTGRWVKQTIVFADGTPEVAVSTYIHSLANSVGSQPSTPQPVARSRVALQYSMYKKPSRASILSAADLDDKAESPSKAPLTQREAFLSEPGMGAHLYGYLTGRNLRTKALHKAILKVLSSESGQVDALSLVSMTPRLFAMPLVFEELHIRDWLRIVRVEKWDEELYQWTQVPGNLDIRLKDLPQDIAERANMSGRSWHNAKVNSVRTLFSMLSFLQILTPLQPCDEAVATVRLDEVQGDHPRTYERAPDATAAPYFILHDVAPVYHVANASLPLLGFMPAHDEEQADKLWGMIKDAAHQANTPHLARIDVPAFPFAPVVSGVLDMTVNLSAALLSKRRWKDELRLLDGQRRALNATIDNRGVRTVNTKDEVTQLAYDLAITPADVETYLARRGRLMAAGERSIRPAPPRAATTYTRSERNIEKAAIREELANRIRAARQVYEQRVQSAAAKVGVEVTQELLDYIVRNRPMTRLGEITSDQELVTIMESFVRVKSGFQLPPRRNPGLTRASTNHIKPSRSRGRPPKPKDYKPIVLPKVEKEKGRRYRHHWTKEEEELILDCEAVIRARARGTQQRGRAAMKEIFPMIGDQVLRAKVKKLLEPPGKAAYYQRLEDAVANILDEFKGTDDLPDPNPGSITHFNLKLYVDFARTKINKALLRLPVSSAPPPGKGKAPELPSDPKELIKRYEWEYLKATNTSFDQILDIPGSEESKLHNISLASMVEEEPRACQPPDASVDRTTSIIRAAIKMVVSTPNQVYNMQAASQLLSNYYKDEYEPQIAALVNEGMLNKNINSMKTPGRMYGYANGWLYTAEGFVPPEVPSQVRGMQAKLAEGEMTWPLVGSPGDLATFMQMVSNHELDIDINADEVPALGMERLAYNTRSLTDASFEWDMRVKRVGDMVDVIRFPSPPAPLEIPSLAPWLVKPGPPEHVQRILDAIVAAGVDGITAGGLKLETGLSVTDIDGAFAALAAEVNPRIFWAGYDNAHAVACEFWGGWTTRIRPRDKSFSPDQGQRVECAARRWVDIWGEVIPLEWDRCMKAVLGQLIVRPGQTEHDLRQRLASVLDRMEVSDVLQALAAAGWIKRRTGLPSSRLVPPVHATDAWEARAIVVTTAEHLWV